MSSITIFFIGDIIGKPGMTMLETWLPTLLQKYRPDVVIANGENACDGKGITQKETDVLFRLGVNVITGGNHTWDRPQSQECLKTMPNVLRPHNYPRGTYGKGYFIHEHQKAKVAVLNLQGRTFMSAIDCPFRVAEAVLPRIKTETNIVFVDFHAEATAEKLSLTYFLDGKVSCVVGTHTHVQTSDERIFPQGTGYITDVGMTGPYDSVIGMKVIPALNRFLYQTPQKYETAVNDVHISAMFVTIDIETGATIAIERIFFPEFEKTFSLSHNKGETVENTSEEKQ